MLQSRKNGKSESPELRISKMQLPDRNLAMSVTSEGREKETVLP